MSPGPLNNGLPVLGSLAPRVLALQIDLQRDKDSIAREVEHTHRHVQEAHIGTRERCRLDQSELTSLGTPSMFAVVT